ncbi:hypothetical protein [Fructilactobacillus carniphilus]|uniref:Uncharacterized protein n=1 Tax=Fructilactobacillus carniphilus TaxID=2940297 RepID=A0ABY5BWN2_9LACO|nr:hypothetical protein [Fructilactobacillus carniphilus]USS90904.1 hypothetical protein M3M37_01480 [Fructilactobacillus carniphilus]
MDDRKQTTGNPEPEMTRQAFRRQQQQSRRNRFRQSTDSNEPTDPQEPLRQAPDQDPEARHRRLAHKLDFVIIILIILIIAVLCVMRFVD